MPFEILNSGIQNNKESTDGDFVACRTRTVYTVSKDRQESSNIRSCGRDAVINKPYRPLGSMDSVLGLELIRRQVKHGVNRKNVIRRNNKSIKLSKDRIVQKESEDSGNNNNNVDIRKRNTIIKNNNVDDHKNANNNDDNNNNDNNNNKTEEEDKDRKNKDSNSDENFLQDEIDKAVDLNEKIWIIKKRKLKIESGIYSQGYKEIIESIKNANARIKSLKAGASLTEYIHHHDPIESAKWGTKQSEIASRNKQRTHSTKQKQSNNNEQDTNSNIATTSLVLVKSQQTSGVSNTNNDNMILTNSGGKGGLSKTVTSNVVDRLKGEFDQMDGTRPAAMTTTTTNSNNHKKKKKENNHRHEGFSSPQRPSTLKKPPSRRTLMIRRSSTKLNAHGEQQHVLLRKESTKKSLEDYEEEPWLDTGLKRQQSTNSVQAKNARFSQSIISSRQQITQLEAFNGAKPLSEIQRKRLPSYVVQFPRNSVAFVDAHKSVQKHNNNNNMNNLGGIGNQNSFRAKGSSTKLLLKDNSVLVMDRSELLQTTKKESNSSSSSSNQDNVNGDKSGGGTNKEKNPKSSIIQKLEQDHKTVLKKIKHAAATSEAIQKAVVQRSAEFYETKSKLEQDLSNKIGVSEFERASEFRRKFVALDIALKEFSDHHTIKQNKKHLGKAKSNKFNPNKQLATVRSMAKELKETQVKFNLTNSVWYHTLVAKCKETSQPLSTAEEKFLAAFHQLILDGWTLTPEIFKKVLVHVIDRSEHKLAAIQRLIGLIRDNVLKMDLEEYVQFLRSENLYVPKSLIEKIEEKRRKSKPSCLNISLRAAAIAMKWKRKSEASAFLLNASIKE